MPLQLHTLDPRLQYLIKLYFGKHEYFTKEEASRTPEGKGRYLTPQEEAVLLTKNLWCWRPRCKETDGSFLPKDMNALTLCRIGSCHPNFFAIFGFSRNKFKLRWYDVNIGTFTSPSEGKATRETMRRVLQYAEERLSGAIPGARIIEAPWPLFEFYEGIAQENELCSQRSKNW